MAEPDKLVKSEIEPKTDQDERRAETLTKALTICWDARIRYKDDIKRDRELDAIELDAAVNGSGATDDSLSLPLTPHFELSF